MKVLFNTVVPLLSVVVLPPDRLLGYCLLQLASMKEFSTRPPVISRIQQLCVMASSLVQVELIEKCQSRVILAANAHSAQPVNLWMEDPNLDL